MRQFCFHYLITQFFPTFRSLRPHRRRRGLRPRFLSSGSWSLWWFSFSSRATLYAVVKATFKKWSQMIRWCYLPVLNHYRLTVSLTNVYVKALTPQNDCIWRGVLVENKVKWGQKGRFLVLRISVLVRKEVRGLVLSPHTHTTERPWAYSEKVVVYKSERRLSAGTKLTQSWTFSLQNWEKHISVV